MKKYAAIVGLALLLVGIAYIRAIFSHQEYASGISAEVGAAIPQDILDDYVMKKEASARQDSLRRLYADSLDNMRDLVSAASENTQESDSLQALVSELRRKLDSAEKKSQEARQEKDIQFEKLIAGFYKGEIERLPADLTEYEREVSVNEIRNKALKYFGVSSKRLDRIIKKYR